MLLESDNFIAEQILMMASIKLNDSIAPDKVISYMKENYLNDLPQMKWVDGSGLSRYNLFTPKTIVLLLAKIKQEVPQDKIIEHVTCRWKNRNFKELF